MREELKHCPLAFLSWFAGRWLLSFAYGTNGIDCTVGYTKELCILAVVVLPLTSYTDIWQCNLCEPQFTHLRK